MSTASSSVADRASEAKRNFCYAFVPLKRHNSAIKNRVSLHSMSGPGIRDAGLNPECLEIRP